MAQVIKLRRSAVAGNVPTTAQLGLGELAINTADGKIYFEKNDGSATIQTIVTTNSQTTGSIEITGNISGSSTSTGSFGTIRSAGLPLYVDDTKVGIGTTSVSGQLEIRSAIANSQIYLGGSTAGTYGKIYSDNTGIFIIAADAGNNASNSYFGVEVDGSQYLKIDSSGHIISNTANAKISGSATSTGSFGHIESTQAINWW